jgi:NADH-quinone oxidoreductase subunit L
VLGLLCTLQLEGRRLDVDLFTFVATGLAGRAGRPAVRPAVGAVRLLITGVGCADPRLLDRLHGARPAPPRFFAYLNLFVAAMLLLVLGDNFVALYVGWEGVGLASYLLIAFWHERPSAATAAKKAFIMNRVGDVGLALAIFLMFAQLGHRLLRRASSARSARWPAARSPRSGCCSCSARAASPASSRCRRGCPTPWRARPRCRR